MNLQKNVMNALYGDNMSLLDSEMGKLNDEISKEVL